MPLIRTDVFWRPIGEPPVGEETVFIDMGGGNVLGTETGDYIVFVIGDEQEPPS